MRPGLKNCNGWKSSVSEAGRLMRHDFFAGCFLFLRRALLDIRKPHGGQRIAGRVWFGRPKAQV